MSGAEYPIRGIEHRRRQTIRDRRIVDDVQIMAGQTGIKHW